MNVSVQVNIRHIQSVTHGQDIGHKSIANSTIFVSTFNQPFVIYTVFFSKGIGQAEMIT